MITFAPGEVFLGKYRIEEVLGQGGMGVVVAARHLELDELVAIKLLHATFATQPEQVERFLREGRAAVKIKSEHVARVRDVGKLENGAPYMILEHLTGSDLGKLLKEEGRLPVDEAVMLMLQACEALAEAHAAGIVHRDLKPANIFLTERADGSSCVKVLDFGISKLLDGTGGNLTATNGMMGSPLYMSPEQLAAAKNVDKRADIWALGVMLFELVAGERPFHAESIPQIVMVVVSQPPVRLESIIPDVPPGLAAVIGKCLEKQADERYQNVGELAKALEPFAPPEAAASIERIMRVASGTAVRRTRTNRTNPNPEASQPITPIETAPTMASQPPLPRLEQTNLGGSVQTQPPVEPAPRRRVGIYVALGVAAVLAVIAGIALRKPDSPITAAPQPTTEPTHFAVAPSASASVTPSATAEPAPPSAASPSTSGSSPSWIVKVPPVKTASPAKPSASAPKPNCDPPYVIDGDGNKKYKMECL